MDLDDETLWKHRKKLTDPEQNYKRMSNELVAAYAALPNGDSKAAFVVFTHFMRNKYYGWKGQQYKESDYEEKRLYTDTPIDWDMLLRDVDPLKYVDKTSSKSNQQQMGNRILRLHGWNVIYKWTYKKVHHMLIIEREIGCWTVFNPKGCVTPDTLLKILAGYKHMLDDMTSYCAGVRPIDRKDMENSLGCFFNAMIHKMNHTVASSIPRWRSSCDLGEYVLRLEGELKKKSPWEGLVIDPVFYKRIPPSLSALLMKYAQEEREKKTVEQGEENMVSKLEKEIVPDKPMIGKPSAPREKRESPVSTTDRPVAVLRDLSEIPTPFKSEKDFTNYFRNMLKSLRGDDVYLNIFDDDIRAAGQVMDILIEAKKDDLENLDAWIRYFANSFLRGTKGRNTKYSSMKCFGTTYAKFKEKLYLPQK